MSGTPGATIPAPMSRRPGLALAAVLAAVVTLAGGAALIRHPTGRPAPAASVAHRPAKAPPAAASSGQEDPDAQCAVRPLKMPSGTPTELSCRDARRVIAQVRGRIAEPAGHPDPRLFAESVVGWLDPHGLWSAAPDAPAARSIRSLAEPLIDEIERMPTDPTPCNTAREIAGVTQRWVESLRHDFDMAERHAPRLSPSRAFALDSRGIFQDDPVTRPARQLAVALGTRAGIFARAYGKPGEKVEQDAAERLLPTLGIDRWAGIVLAAAVRAYVPEVDAHGQWAPLDEEWSLYVADATVDTGPRLWGEMMRTPVGVRVVQDPTPPLRAGDLVLAVGGIATAGLSVEQIEQLARLEAVGGETTRSVEVLRRGATAPVDVNVDLPPDGDDSSPAPQLDSERVPYGDGNVLVVSIPDVPDGLGDELARLVADAKTGNPPKGILLDLRGNGGGSTDGASGAIGVFLPGAPSFPLRHRGGALEVQRALSPAVDSQWKGPVATLVDGYTASAAEMIAGALGSYHRGPIVGSRTFGKGCIQEYFDDRSGVGVLRLTTMLFALPDGTPLQHVGLVPDIRIATPPVHDTEKLLADTMPRWRGPDVRRRTQIGGPAWPPDDGRVGPCRDSMVCRALRSLGARSAHLSAAAVVPRGPRRASSGAH